MAYDKKILSIDSDDDDKSYLAFSEYLEEDTERKKKLTAREIQEIADDLVLEIERKKRNQKLKSQKLIPYILKHSEEKYSEKELLGYSYNDVQDIYNEIKAQRQESPAVKFFHFIFNL
jgi:uncharacterized protein YfkK (UPF0435 family)